MLKKQTEFEHTTALLRLYKNNENHNGTQCHLSNKNPEIHDAVAVILFCTI